MITMNSYQDFATQLAMLNQVSPLTAKALGRTLAEKARLNHARLLHYAMGYRPDQPEY